MDIKNVSNIINQHGLNDIYGRDINVIKHFIKKNSAVSVPLINKAVTDSISSNCRKY